MKRVDLTFHYSSDYLISSGDQDLVVTYMKRLLTRDGRFDKED